MKQIIIALVIALLVDTSDTSDPWYKQLFQKLFSPRLTVPEAVVVVGLDGDGVYFYFDQLVLDRILGRSNWDGQTLWASRTPDGDRRAIKLWRTGRKKIPGTAHGRYYLRHKAKDWHRRDRIYVFETPK